MLRKRLIILGALALVIFASCASSAKPTAVPFDGTTQVVDLSTGWAPIMAYFTFAKNYSSVNAKNLEFFQFPLAKELSNGESIEVTLKGKNNGSAGFRVWLTDGQQVTLSNLFVDAVGDKLPAGNFEFTFTLTAQGPVENLFVKGPSWDKNIDDIDISYIKIVYQQ